MVVSSDLNRVSVRPPTGVRSEGVPLGLETRRRLSPAAFFWFAHNHARHRLLPSGSQAGKTAVRLAIDMLRECYLAHHCFAGIYWRHYAAQKRAHHMVESDGIRNVRFWRKADIRLNGHERLFLAKADIGGSVWGVKHPTIVARALPKIQKYPAAARNHPGCQGSFHLSQ